MEQPISTPATDLLKVDFNDKDKIWLSDQNSLRKLVGILGMLLPVLLYVFLYFASGHLQPLASISHYYFTRSTSIFSIIVSLLAIFLLLYKGKEPVDFYLSSIAGLAALCVLLFPTTNLASKCCDPNASYAITYLVEGSNSFRSNFHYISAGIFLTCLAMLSLFFFTKSDKSVQARGQQKRRRNRIFRVCGSLMLVALAIILAGYCNLIPPTFYDAHHLTFWMESLAVESFGFSWLVKGEFILKDK